MLAGELAVVTIMVRWSCAAWRIYCSDLSFVSKEISSNLHISIDVKRDLKTLDGWKSVTMACNMVGCNNLSCVAVAI